MTEEDKTRGVKADDASERLSTPKEWSREEGGAYMEPGTETPSEALLSSAAGCRSRAFSAFSRPCASAMPWRLQ